jgi:peptidoglycan/LPS O-acetylase OafA/YrhL
LPWAVLLAGSTQRLSRGLFAIVAISMLTRLTSILIFSADFLASWKLNTLWQAGSIAIGVLCALHYDELNPRRPKILALAGAIAILVGYFYPDNVNAPNLLAGGAGAFILGSAKGNLFASDIWRIPAQIGKASYEIYLLHMPVFYFIGPYLRGFSALGGWLALATVSFAVGHLVRIGFSEPVNLLLRQQFLRRPALIG